jgi:ABC-2 type transport system ATP-binding protein
MEAMVHFNDVHLSLGGVRILENIQGDIYPGDVIGLIGKNGSGKTSLINVLLGFTVPTQGEARVFTDEARDLSVASKSRIGYVPQQDQLIRGLTAVDHLRLMRRLREASGVWNQPLIDRLMVEWEIPPLKNVDKLSLGQRQKLSILLAIGHEPDLLILDEPVASLDPIARRQFLNELVRIAERETCAILFSTHILSDVERIANKVWLMGNHTLRLQTSLDDLKETVTRLRVSGLPADIRAFTHPQLINKTLSNNFARFTFKEAVPVQELENAGLQLIGEVEHLGLEEIFVEMADHA